jgi:hypothetical protein
MREYMREYMRARRDKAQNGGKVLTEAEDGLKVPVSISRGSEGRRDGSEGKTSSRTTDACGAATRCRCPASRARLLRRACSSRPPLEARSGSLVLQRSAPNLRSQRTPGACDERTTPGRPGISRAGAAMSDALDVLDALVLEDGSKWIERAAPFQIRDAKVICDPAASMGEVNRELAAAQKDKASTETGRPVTAE